MLLPPLGNSAEVLGVATLGNNEVISCRDGAYTVSGTKKDKCITLTNAQWGGSLSLTTPTFRTFSGTAAMTLGQVPVFREAAPG